MTISRRQILWSTAAVAGAYTAGFFSRDLFDYLTPDPIEAAQRQVLPAEVHTGVEFGDSIARLVKAGVIVPEKLTAIYKDRGGVPAWMMKVLYGADDGGIVISVDNSTDLLTLLWPLGLATKTGFSRTAMPLSDDELARLASTGGWTLGKESNGAAYFAKVETLSLTPDQETKIAALANGIYRPCCDNNAAAQDCNHGSAMLGFLELAISQGMSEEKVFALAKVLNGFWYPREYIAMALLFDYRDGKSWPELSPQMVLGRDYSSASGWRANVAQPLADSGLLQRAGSSTPGGAGCAL